METKILWLDPTLQGSAYEPLEATDWSTAATADSVPQALNAAYRAQGINAPQTERSSYAFDVALRTPRGDRMVRLDWIPRPPLCADGNREHSRIVGAAPSSLLGGGVAQVEGELLCATCGVRRICTGREFYYQMPTTALMLAAEHRWDYRLSIDSKCELMNGRCQEWRHQESEFNGWLFDDGSCISLHEEGWFLGSPLMAERLGRFFRLYPNNLREALVQDRGVVDSMQTFGFKDGSQLEFTPDKGILYR